MNYNKRQQLQKQKTEDYYRSLVGGNTANQQNNTANKAPTVKPNQSVPQKKKKKKKKSFLARFIYAIKKTSELNKIEKNKTITKKTTPKPSKAKLSKTNTLERLSDTISDYRSKPMSKKKRRFGNIVFVTLLVIVMAFVSVFVSMLFFKVDTITAEGNSKYTAEEIVNVCGIEYEVSMFSLNEEEINNVICDTLPYVKHVDVSKKFPGTVVLTVTETHPVAAIGSGGIFVLVDADSKILDIASDRGNLPVYSGVSISSDTVPGLYAQYASEDSAELITALSEAFENGGILNEVTAVNIEKRYDISFEYNGNITCEIADISDLETKIGMIKAVTAENSKTMKAVIDASDPDRVYYRPIT